LNLSAYQLKPQTMEQMRRTFTMKILEYWSITLSSRWNHLRSSTCWMLLFIFWVCYLKWNY